MQNRPFFSLCLLLLAASAYSDLEQLALPNGDRYEGEVVDGRLNGLGTYIWADGDRYEGDFADDLPHGRGRYTWADGRRYEGQFEGGKRQGSGSLTWANGDRYDGGFVDNQMTGQGELQWSNGDRYQGGFAANERAGQGVMQWGSGQRYEGTFRDGLMHGQGMYQWPDGSRYRGTFKQDKRTGAGLFVESDQSTYSVNFIDGRPDGYGVRRLNGGELLLQKWRDGTVIDSKPITINSRCRFNDDAGTWMVDANDCVNGLAHGDGVAVTLNGNRLVVSGNWVLGNRIAGDLINLPVMQQNESAADITVPVSDSARVASDE